MNKEFVVSFCDTVFPVFDNEKWSQSLSGNSRADRVYIGSYFCEGYFLRYEKFDLTEFGEWIRNRGVQASLIIPVVRQPNLDKAKQIIRRIVESGIVDEVIVNDVGMLDYISSDYDIFIHLGRLFLKNTRDLRGPFPRLGAGENYYSAVYSQLLTDYKFRGIEADAVALEMDFEGMPEDMILGMHEGWTYLTTGRMCAFAAAGLPENKKFCPDEKCRLECIGNPVFYNLEGGIAVKAGKTCYCAARPVDVINANNLRIINTVNRWEHNNHE